MTWKYSTNLTESMHSLLHYIIYWGRGLCQMVKQKIFLIFDIKICGAFLVQFFCSSATTLRGQKDTLAQVYFYWGAIAPPPGSTPLPDRVSWPGLYRGLYEIWHVPQHNAIQSNRRHLSSPWCFDLVREFEHTRPGMKVWVGNGIPNNSKYDCWQIMTVSF